VPIAADRPDDERRLAGNKVSNLFTSLATDQPDPVRRLRTIHEVTAEAKVVQDLLGVETMQQWVQYTPPRPYSWVVQRWSHHRVADRLPPPINVVVSNVPGPRHPLHVAGTTLEHLYSVGPVLEGIGLNVTVWSYLDHLDVGIIACREAVPRPARLAELLHEALADLSAAARPAADLVTSEAP
jgi:diacylglycerol O-acyltransferase / wax synthase